MFDVEKLAGELVNVPEMNRQMNAEELPLHYSFEWLGAGRESDETVAKGAMEIYRHILIRSRAPENVLAEEFQKIHPENRGRTLLFMMKLETLLGRDVIWGRMGYDLARGILAQEPSHALRKQLVHYKFGGQWSEKKSLADEAKLQRKGMGEWTPADVREVARNDRLRCQHMKT